MTVAGDTLPVLEYDVTATTVVLGALASRDWRPMHHDHDFAVNRNGTKDIFMNTPNLAAWFERYITDWTGPKGRLGRITFRIRDSIFPGNVDAFRGDGDRHRSRRRRVQLGIARDRTARRRPAGHHVHRAGRHPGRRQRQPVGPHGRRLETVSMRETKA